MVEDDIVPKLVKFIPCSNKNLMKAVTRLLLNLSFDPTLRDQMVKQSLVPKLVDLLKHAPFRQISLKVLYHLSMDDACKSMFTYTEAIPIIMQMLINFPNSKIPIELIALAINLSHNARNAEMMAKEGGLKKLFHRVLRHRDVLLMKVLRNISQHTYDKACESGKNNNNSSGSGQRGEGKMRTMTAVEAVEENPVRDAQNETHPFGHLMLWICSSCASSLQLKMQIC